MTKTRTRRTPEQLAATYQAKANQQRAKARKMAKDAKIREQIELGKAAQALGIADKDELVALATIGTLVKQTFGRGSKLNMGKKFHLVGFGEMMQPDDEQAEVIGRWWAANGMPIGPDRKE